MSALTYVCALNDAILLGDQSIVASFPTEAISFNDSHSTESLICFDCWEINPRNQELFMYLL